MVTTPLSTTTTTQETSTSWSQLFQQLENQGYIIDDLVKDTLEQQLSNNLLPIKIEKITEQYLILSYQNTIEAETILSAFPILKSLYESLNLTQDIVSIENPSLIIENYQNNEAIFQLQIPNLQTSAISSLLTQIGLLGIPDSNNINLNLAENSLSLTYLGDVSFSNLLQSIPTVETIANELNLPNNITISNPSITINQSTSQTPNYDISVSQLPITELTDWLEAQLIPTELLTTVNNIDLQLSDKDIKVTYLGEVNLSSVINTMTRELGYNNTIEQTLTVLNPSLLIQEKADNTKFYELTLSQIPTNEITGLLANLTEVNLFNELGTLGEVDLVVSSNGIEVSYDDTINLDIGTVISLNEKPIFLTIYLRIYCNRIRRNRYNFSPSRKSYFTPERRNRNRR
ncbi:hypothetical protein [Cyanothece sp. BG0011]|uniref:hypothetical protein n=1 Tax=Cyanothece sp. BG0011 TaxID=2082950 RepID=UPI000D1E89B6|nr:hypothetical protein [Cyanothece sp. BG0011]